jgi:hypothetical protein
MEQYPIRDLIRRVDEFQRASEREAIEKLTTENALLRDLVIAYQESWSHIVDLLGQANQGLALLCKALERYLNERVASERARSGVSKAFDPLNGMPGRVDTVGNQKFRSIPPHPRKTRYALCNLPTCNPRNSFNYASNFAKTTSFASQAHKDCTSIPFRRLSEGYCGQI